MCSISLVTRLLIWSLGIILCVSQGKGLLLPHSPPSAPHSCWSGARLLMGALLMEKKGRRPCLMVIQLLMPFPQSSSGEVVLATFKIVFSLKITPTAPTPSPWILGSIHPTEICFLKLIFFRWLASCLFFEVVVSAGGGTFFSSISSPLEHQHIGTSQTVQWLGLHTPSVGGTGSIHGQGTRSHKPCIRTKTNKNS